MTNDTPISPRKRKRPRKVVLHKRALEDEYTAFGRGVRFTAFRIGIAESTLAKALRGQVGDMTIKSLNKIANFFDLTLTIEFSAKRRD